MFRALRPAPALPEDFIFGVATADHQVEAYDARVEDIRDIWERRLQQTLRGRATDFWNRYPEDIGLARELGCTAFRFSIAWSRVEPAPGQFGAQGGRLARPRARRRESREEPRSSHTPRIADRSPSAFPRWSSARPLPLPGPGPCSATCRPRS